MSDKKLSASEARRAYMNAWRAKNKERVKQYNKQYWERKAEEMQRGGEEHENVNAVSEDRRCR